MRGGFPVRIISLDRPERLNAWAPTMQTELFDAFASGNDDPSIGAFAIRVGINPQTGSIPTQNGSWHSQLPVANLRRRV